METQTQTVRVGRRTWVVETTWAGRGTRQVRIVRTRRRRAGSQTWTEHNTGNWPQGTVITETWQ